MQKGRGKGVPWLDLICDKTINPHVKKLSDIIVPTLDTACSTHLMDIMINHNRAILFIGPTGTGKSVYVKVKLMNGLDKDV